MNDRIRMLAEKALAGDPFPPCVRHTVDYTTDPRAVGEAIAKYYELQTITIPEGEWLVDRYRFHGLNVPDCFYRCSGQKHRSAYWGTLCRYRPTDTFYWGWTHVALDFGYILNNGFQGYLDRIEAARGVHGDSPEKIAFLDGMESCLHALIARYVRYADLAAEMAQSAPDAARRAALLRIADTCRRIPQQPAESFYDAVQFTWIAFAIVPDSLGRIDQYLYPYYTKDVAAGRITEDEAFQLLEELFIKAFESQVDNKDLPISGHNHLVVGGYLQNGEDASIPYPR